MSISGFDIFSTLNKFDNNMVNAVGVDGKTFPQQNIEDLDIYELFQFLVKGGSREQQLVDRLLFSAMIEARSCERFRLLSLNVEDPELQKFYHEFMVSEAGHYKAFINLAKKYADENYVLNRWAEYVVFEAEMVKTLAIRGDRMH